MAVPTARTWAPKVELVAVAWVLAAGAATFAAFTDDAPGRVLLATVALCVATTILVKMGRARYLWVTLLPLAWLVSVTFTASYQKIFSPNVRIGFLAHAQQLAQEAPANAARAHEVSRLIFNDRLDAALTIFFLVTVWVMIADTSRVCYCVLAGRKHPPLSETPYLPKAEAAEMLPEPVSL